MSSEPEEEKKIERRKLLSSGIGFVLNAYLQSRSLLNPVGLAAGAIDEYQQQQQDRQEAEMRAMVSQIENLRATFEDGKLVVHLDKSSILGLAERVFKKYFAAREAGMTAKFRIESGDDHEAVLLLPSRSIYLKFVPEGTPVSKFANSYLERARNANPSEYWLLAPNEENIDIPFEPIFSEKGVTRGRLRTLSVTDILRELVGKEYDLTATYDTDGGFKFVISKKQATLSDKEKT